MRMLTATVGKFLITKDYCKHLRTHSRRSERPRIMGVWRCKVSSRCGIRNDSLAPSLPSLLAGPGSGSRSSPSPRMGKPASRSIGEAPQVGSQWRKNADFNSPCRNATEDFAYLHGSDRANTRARRALEPALLLLLRRPFAPHRKPESPQFGVIRTPRGKI